MSWRRSSWSSWWASRSSTTCRRSSSRESTPPCPGSDQGPWDLGVSGAAAPSPAWKKRWREGGSGASWTSRPQLQASGRACPQPSAPGALCHPTPCGCCLGFLKVSCPGASSCVRGVLASRAHPCPGWPISLQPTLAGPGHSSSTPASRAAPARSTEAPGFRCLPSPQCHHHWHHCGPP